MTTTASHSITSAAWVQVANGSTNVRIRVTGRYSAAVHVGTAEPNIAAAFEPLCAGEKMELENLAGTDLVYVRAEQLDTAVSVIEW